MEIPEKFKYINMEYLYAISENKDFIKKMLMLFAEQVEIFNRELPILLEQKNYTNLRELVHKAKSSTAIIGMKEQSNEMRLLETDLKNKTNTETFAERIRSFLSDCNAALTELEIIKKEYL